MQPKSVVMFAGFCRQEHPEALEQIGGSSSGTYMSRQFGVAMPPKTITTMQLYINEKCEEDQRKGSKVRLSLCLFCLGCQYCSCS